MSLKTNYFKTLKYSRFLHGIKKKPERKMDPKEYYRKLKAQQKLAEDSRKALVYGDQIKEKPKPKTILRKKVES